MGIADVRQSTETLTTYNLEVANAHTFFVEGKKYYIGATLRYRYAGEDQTLDVSPALVTVKPLPLLTLDYFLTRDVVGDDPVTPEVRIPPGPRIPTRPRCRRATLRAARVPQRADALDAPRR